MNAKNAILMEAAEASVNKLSDPSLIRFVSAAAAADADSSRYATICNFNVHKIYVTYISHGRAHQKP